MWEVCLTYDWGTNQDWINAAKSCQKNLWDKSCVIFPTWIYGRHIDNHKMFNEYTADKITHDFWQVVWNHTMTHLTQYWNGNIPENVLFNELLWVEKLGWPNVLFMYRPPYWNRSWVNFPWKEKEIEWVTIKWKKYLFVRWDVDSLDWQPKNMANPHKNYTDLLSKIEKEIAEKKWWDIVVLLHTTSELTKQYTKNFHLLLKNLLKKKKYTASCKNLLTKYHEEIWYRKNPAPVRNPERSNKFKTVNILVGNHQYENIPSIVMLDWSLLIQVKNSKLTPWSIFRKFPKILKNWRVVNLQNQDSWYYLQWAPKSYRLVKW